MFAPFDRRLARLIAEHEALIFRPNEVDLSWDNGIYLRRRYPVLTAVHARLTWRYDLNAATNPFLLKRKGWPLGMPLSSQPDVLRDVGQVGKH